LWVTNLKGMQPCTTRTDRATQGSGKTIESMERDNIAGRTATDTWVSINRGRGRDLVLCIMATNRHTKGTG
jgi:hypothetical protein